jgi:hypothetical protein
MSSTDGSHQLLPESKWGHAVSLLTTAVALGAAEALGALDLSALPTWASATAAAAIGTAVGVLTSWAKTNRTATGLRD